MDPSPGMDPSPFSLDATFGATFGAALGTKCSAIVAMISPESACASTGMS
jgi:hypothetical protein